MSIPNRASYSTDRLLKRVFQSIHIKFVSGNRPNFGDLLQPLGTRSAALGSCLLALPFLSPISLGPLSLPASILITLLGVQLLSNRRNVPLPKRFLETPISRRAFDFMKWLVIKLLRFKRRIATPRHGVLVSGKAGRKICALGLVIGAFILAIPIPLLPLTNTFPALGIILMAIGWVERDDFLTVLGMASQAFGFLIIAGVFIAAFFLGLEVTELIGNLIPWLGESEERIVE